MFLQKTISTLAAAGLILALSMMFVPAANAANDEQATMVRHGRFVWHKPALTAKATAQPAQAAKANGVLYDKGELGIYKRHGRVVEKVHTIAPRTSSGERHYAGGRHKVSNDFKRPFS